MGSLAHHEHNVTVVQGECKTSPDADIVFSTILGSCVSACMFDRTARIGGMNHFLLPGDTVARHADESVYGAYQMELLINGLMRLGAQRSRIEAKLFGGGRIVAGLSDIGRRNAEFAARYLDYEGIPVIGKDIGGDHARRLQFWPATGRARVRYAVVDDPRLAAQEQGITHHGARPATRAGAVELF